MASALARAYIGGLGAMPPVGSRGKAPGQGSGGLRPPEAGSFLHFQWLICVEFVHVVRYFSELLCIILQTEFIAISCDSILLHLQHN